MDVLFSPAFLVYTLPILFAAGLWAITAFGLFDFDGLDIDADVDADLDVDLDADVDGGGSVLALFGGAPLSLIASLVLFWFGLAGLILHTLLGTFLDGFGWSTSSRNVLIAPAALVLGTLAAAGISRVVGPALHQSGQASRRSQLVGQMAVVNSSTVSATFGSAIVRLDNGDRIEVNVRSHDDAEDIRYGQRVVLFEHNPDANSYSVSRIELD
ncbi:MAG: hypothetical protein AAGI08_09520 [Bacteroidota bacterium]